jgi:hypothetical protein
LQDHEREIDSLKRELASLSRDLNRKHRPAEGQATRDERFEHRLERAAHELEGAITEAREIAHLATRFGEPAPEAPHVATDAETGRALERVEELVERLHKELAVVTRTLQEGEARKDRGLL